MDAARARICSLSLLPTRYRAVSLLRLDSLSLSLSFLSTSRLLSLFLSSSFPISFPAMMAARSLSLALWHTRDARRTRSIIYGESLRDDEIPSGLLSFYLFFLFFFTSMVLLYPPPPLRGISHNGEQKPGSAATCSLEKTGEQAVRLPPGQKPIETTRQIADDFSKWNGNR